MNDADLFPQALQDLLLDIGLDRLDEEVLARVAERLLDSDVTAQVVNLPLAQVLPTVRSETPAPRVDIALPPELPAVVAARFMERRQANTALVIVGGQRHLVSRDKLVSLVQARGYTFSSQAARTVPRTWQVKGLEIATLFLSVYDRAGSAECRRQVCYQCTVDPQHTFPGGKGRTECCWGDYRGHVRARVTALATTDPCCG